MYWQENEAFAAMLHDPTRWKPPMNKGTHTNLNTDTIISKDININKDIREAIHISKSQRHVQAQAQENVNSSDQNQQIRHEWIWQPAMRKLSSLVEPIWEDRLFVTHCYCWGIKQTNCWDFEKWLQTYDFLHLILWCPHYLAIWLVG